MKIKWSPEKKRSLPKFKGLFWPKSEIFLLHHYSRGIWCSIRSDFVGLFPPFNQHSNLDGVTPKSRWGDAQSRWGEAQFRWGDASLPSPLQFKDWLYLRPILFCIIYENCTLNENAFVAHANTIKARSSNFQERKTKPTEFIWAYICAATLCCTEPVSLAFCSESISARNNSFWNAHWLDEAWENHAMLGNIVQSRDLFLKQRIMKITTVVLFGISRCPERRYRVFKKFLFYRIIKNRIYFQLIRSVIFETS